MTTLIDREAVDDLLALLAATHDEHEATEDDLKDATATRVACEQDVARHLGVSIDGLRRLVRELREQR